MYVIHVFGACTSTGSAFLENISRFHQLNESYKVLSYSRSAKGKTFVDLLSPDTFTPDYCSGQKHVLISFAPLVLFAPFLSRFLEENPLFADCVSCVCALSSTSAEVKRFSFNKFDKTLSSALIVAETCLASSCRNHSVHNLIIRPTMIYGNSEQYSDTNINYLLSLLRHLPVIFLPRDSGLRQPIHYTQLSNVVFSSVLPLLMDETGFRSLVISVGGDSTISYHEMLTALQDCSVTNDPARRCSVILVPSKFFVLFLVPVSFFSLKLFEALLRIFADLSGFTCASSITGQAPKEFPIQ